MKIKKIQTAAFAGHRKLPEDTATLETATEKAVLSLINRILRPSVDIHIHRGALRRGRQIRVVCVALVECRRRTLYNTAIDCDSAVYVANRRAPLR